MDLPDPDEVPRRAAAPGRAAARPRVRDEGLLLLRRRRRRPGPRPTPRTARPTSGSSTGSGLDYVIVVGAVRCDGRLEERGVPHARRGRRGHLRAVHDLRLRRQRRGAAHPGAAGHAVRRRAGRARRGHPGHADHRDAGRAGQRARRPAPAGPRVDRRRHAEERRGQAAPARTARPSCSPIGAARRPRGRREAARGRRCTRRSSSRSPRRTSPTTPGLVRGYLGPAALGSDKPAAVRYLLDPRVVEGTRWITGANEPGRHVFDLVAGRDFTGDGTIEAASVFEGDPCPNDDGGTPGDRPRHRDGPHLPARPQVRRRARPQGARRERQAGRGHDGVLRHRRRPAPSRRSPRRPSTTSGSAGRAPSPPPTCTWWRPARTTRCSRPPQSLADELVAQGLDVLYDDRRGVSPGVKFKDAELLGMPTIVVVGKGLADGTIEVRDRRTGEREDVPVADAAARDRGAPSGRDREPRSRRSSSTGAAR